jgi:endonuclease YncB( thermonuclease family)
MGLARGSGLHELAIFDLQTQKAYEYLFKPNLVVSQGGTKQDILKLATTRFDVTKRHPGIDKHSIWRDVIIAQLEMAMGEKSGALKNIKQAALLEQLEKIDPFQARMLRLGKSPAYGGGTEAPAVRIKAIRERGGNINEIITQRTTIEDALRPGSDMLKRMKGKTIWIANAPFESKQIGAQIAALPPDVFEAVRAGNISKEDALAAQLRKSGLHEGLASYNPQTADNLYVTGKKVNAARARAQHSGDWRQVYEAYLRNTGAGDVRDIMDVLKAQQSYGRQLGLFKAPGGTYGLSMDLSARLFGSTEKDPELAKIMFRGSEAHRAVEDDVLEAFVLRRSVETTEALRQVELGGVTGKKLIQEARRGEGHLYTAMTYLKRLETLAPELQGINLTQRFDRMFQDIATQGYTAQYAGSGGTRAIHQMTPNGELLKVPVNLSARETFRDVNQAAHYIMNTGQYDSAQVSGIWERMTARLKEGGGLKMEGGRLKVGDATALQRISAGFKEEHAGVGSLEKLIGNLDGGVDEFLRRTSLPQLMDNLNQGGSPKTNSYFAGIKPSRAMKGGLLAAASVTALGLAFGNRNDQRPDSHTVFRTQNYQKWKEYQANFGGLNDNDKQWRSGMNESGTAASSRRHNTDFGSPYRGPWTSNQVLLDQDLLAERENYMRSLYGAKHYDPVAGVFADVSTLRAFNPLRHASSIPAGFGGSNVDASEYAGMKGKNLLGINLSSGEWKLTAEDADTVSVARRGIVGGIQSFFGMNKYSFRLAGIDSPELSHGSRSWYSPQPHAKQATSAMEAIIAGAGNLEIIYDPTQTTYGRGVGVLFADKRNVNFDLVKQGHAAALPFGSWKKSIIDYSVAVSHEARAREAGRGLHAEPFWQTYYAMSDKMNQRLTFNTLAQRGRVAKNATLMSGASLMRQAQEQGYAGVNDLNAAAEIGSTLQRAGTYGDYEKKKSYRSSQAPHNNYMNEMLRDTAELMKTKGGRVHDKFKHRGNYGRLDKKMSLDTAGTTTSPYAKRSLQAYKAYGADVAAAREREHRRSIQAAAQRQVNQSVFNSAIGHHRM